MARIMVAAENRPQEKLTVLGTGDFSRALAKRLSLAGYDVIMGSRNPERRQRLPHLSSFNIASINDALEHSGIIFFAIPMHGYDSLVASSGSQLNGLYRLQFFNNYLNTICKDWHEDHKKWLEHCTE